MVSFIPFHLPPPLLLLPTLQNNLHRLLRQRKDRRQIMRRQRHRNHAHVHDPQRLDPHNSAPCIHYLTYAAARGRMTATHVTYADTAYRSPDRTPWRAGKSTPLAKFGRLRVLHLGGFRA